METIFAKEQQLILESKKFLASNSFQSSIDANNYRVLLDAYSTLLKQMMRIVKMSDITQLELKTIYEKLDMLSRIDVLTGIYNRRYFTETYIKEWNSAVRSKTVLAIVMIDIDYFKKYNDTYGHLQGDECLKAVAKAIQNSIKRPRDMVARFGGEEFVFVFKDTDEQQSLKILKRIHRELEGYFKKKFRIQVTFSAGVINVGNEDFLPLPYTKLLDKVDRMLYLAKDHGRGRAVSSTGETLFTSSNVYSKEHD